ncbi:MAG: hypothetical protein WC381_08920 [Kiritimatiellia bacterium]
MHFAFFLLSASASWAGSNLLINGHFDATNEFLRGWKYNYADTGQGMFVSNHIYVAVTNDGSKKHVLSLRIGNRYDTGVQVDSAPIPFTPGARYTLTASVKTTKPDCRIQLDGYRWRPGVKPHANPEFKELRKCYRFTQLYFGAAKGGITGGISPKMGWTTASQTYPDIKMSKMAQENFDKIQFLIVHILAIYGVYDENGPDGFLYVDDVELERVR